MSHGGGDWRPTWPGGGVGTGKRYPPEVRQQARRYYMEGYTLKQIGAQLGMPWETVKTWSRRDRWNASREGKREVEALSEELALEMLRAARQSGNPRAAVAAIRALKAAGLRVPGEQHPPPAEVARMLVESLTRRRELSFILRANKPAVARAVRQTLREIAEGWR